MKFLIDRSNFNLFSKIFEDFSIKRIPDELIYICDKIKNDINLNENFKKNYLYGSYKFEIDIKIDNKEDNNIYYSEIDILNILNNIFNDENYIVKIPVYVESTNPDKNKILSIITHELRHIYDILNISENESKDFIKKRNLNIFKNTKYWSFIFQIYLTLEHELIARNNMIYPSLRWSGIKDKNELLKKYKESFTYTSLIDINNFDALKFINKFELDELLLHTNKFINNVDKSNVCYNYSDLINFYKKWEIFFKKKSKEYIKYAEKEIDFVYNDIIHNKIYEKKERTYYDRDLNTNFISKIFDIWYDSITVNRTSYY